MEKAAAYNIKLYSCIQANRIILATSKSLQTVDNIIK